MPELVALDDGHGLKPKPTPGKRTPFIPEIGREFYENEFNSAVVAFLDVELRRCGFRTMFTAPGDLDAPLKARVDAANKAKADLFVSVHYNALDGIFDGPGRDPEGLAVFIYPGSNTGRRVGQMVLAELLRLTGQKQYNTGVIERDFLVLSDTNMPAILTENGFMDNKREALLMISPEYQRRVAQAHARGICTYFNRPYVAEAVPVVPTVQQPNENGRPLHPAVAQNIIDSFLSPGWHAAKAAGNQASADWIHYCANELRAAAGLPKQ